MFKKAAWQPL